MNFSLVPKSVLRFDEMTVIMPLVARARVVAVRVEGVLEPLVSWTEAAPAYVRFVTVRACNRGTAKVNGVLAATAGTPRPVPVVAALRVTTPLVAVSVTPEPVKLAGTERTKVVPLVTDATVAPAGMPSPLTAMPGTMAAVLVTVTVVLSLMVVALASAEVTVLTAVTMPAMLVPETFMPGVIPVTVVTGSSRTLVAWATPVVMPAGAVPLMP